MGMKFSVCAVDRDLPVTTPFPLRGKTYEECAQIASRLGFDGIELQIQDPSFYNGRELHDMISSYGLGVSAVTTGLAFLNEGMSLSHPDPVIRAATVERLKRQLDLAKELDSSILVGFLRGRQLGRSAVEFESIMRDSVSQVLEYAEDIQTPFIFEHVNHHDGDIWCDTKRTVDFIASFNSPWLKFNCDTYHMIIDDYDIEDTIRYCMKNLTLFHVSDVERNLPDDKHFDFHLAARVLKEEGFDGWCSIECKPLPDTETCCAAGIRYLKEVFG